MNILGVTHPVSLNSAACLIKDGKLVALVEEERFNRLKHSPYMPASEAIKYCLDAGGISLDEVDFIGLGYDNIYNVISADFLNKMMTFVTRTNISSLIYDKTNINQTSFTSTLQKFITDYYQGLFRLPFDYKDKRVKFIRHHIAHIASSYFVSPFKEANIISVDGGGGQEAGMLAVGVGDKVRVLKTISSKNSLGYLYSTITAILGFEPNDGEGKVMGLAAYGNSNAKILPFVGFKDGTAEIDHRKMNMFLSKVIPKLNKNPLDNVNVNLAASVQKTIEEAYVYMGEYLYKKTGIKNFCLAGGVSLNCLANTKLLNQYFTEDIYIQPLSSDAGTSLGAALQIYVEQTGKRPGFLMNHVYLGPEFSNEEIKNVLEKCEVPYFKKLENTERQVAELLARGKVIGWFQGRMEAGPRALGNRSILADPSVTQMKNTINKKIKGREPWRPFAPSILEDYAHEYLLDVKESPFMILGSRVDPKRTKEIIATVHVDGTVRPQTVSQQTNPRFWKLIENFRRLKNIPAVLNTSFNLSGEPIVCTPQDALSTFFRTGLDYLVMGDFIVAKSPIPSTI